jgi:hypothetical protein
VLVEKCLAPCLSNKPAQGQIHRQPNRSRQSHSADRLAGLSSGRIATSLQRGDYATRTSVSAVRQQESSILAQSGSTRAVPSPLTLVAALSLRGLRLAVFWSFDSHSRTRRFRFEIREMRFSFQ